MLKIESLTYASGKTPAGYVCGMCEASGVRLYREYQTFLDHQELTCTKCAIERYNKSHKEPYVSDGNDYSIGWVVAAVPTEDGKTFWGLGAIPEPGVEWWKKLGS